MNKTAMSLIHNSRRLKKGTAYTLGLLLSVVIGWSGFRCVVNPEHPRGATRSRSEIAQRAVRIGSALRGSAQIVLQPALQTGGKLLDRSSKALPNRWLVLCESDRQQMNMLFDDKTGRLVCLITESSRADVRRNRLLPTIDTADAAVTAAVSRLKSLEVLPANAEIALKSRPSQEPHQRGWEVDWLVRTPAVPQPYTLKLVLDRFTGQPTCMIDMQERG